MCFNELGIGWYLSLNSIKSPDKVEDFDSFLSTSIDQKPNWRFFENKGAKNIANSAQNGAEEH